jgi:hypothetical protein
MPIGEGEPLPPGRRVALVLKVAQRLLELDPDTDDRSPEQVGADLVHLRHGIDLLEIRFARDAGSFASTSEYDAQGSVTPIDWIRHNCRMSGHAAAERVCVGEQLHALPQSLAATTEGAVGYAHLALLARTAAWVGEHGGAFREEPLLERALESSVSRFRHLCHHACHAGDPAAYAEEQALFVAERSLSLTPCEDGGYVLGGKLDAVGGATLRTALEPLAKPSGRDDDRDRARRLADALVELAEHALDSGRIPSTASQRAHLQVTTSFETLLGSLGAPAAELEFSLPISARTVARLACDCNLTRVLLDADSAVIDVGRSKRVVSGSTRRALNLRDRHSAWPGCCRPANWTAAHHLKYWTRGGSTDLDNLVLLCHRHHWMVHEGGWQLVKDDEGRLLTIRPPGSARPVVLSRSANPAAGHRLTRVTRVQSSR